MSSCCPGGVCVSVDTYVNPTRRGVFVVKKRVGAELWMTGLK